ncbi:MAG: serine/threonine-protein phosphatase [Paludibacteraceae bacterium]|nr:serine/threonine-protein phosphatase [Paludibacteraceae bacterium]
MKTPATIHFYGQTDMGRQRTNNEDAFVAEQLDNHTILAIAIDGVGGYEGGEVAARIAQTEIPRYMREFRNGERLELLKQAVVSANNAIFTQRQADEKRSEMSCVLTSAVIDAGRKVIDMVHVGDTRLYQFRHHQLTKLSHDHSLVGYREEMGDLTEEQAMNHPQRNVISRDVGSAMHEVADRDFLEATEFPLLPNSILLFCSDGLTDLVTSKQIIAVLEQTASLREKAQQLIDAANAAGGKDNITVVLVEYQAAEPAPAQAPVPPTPAQPTVRPVHPMPAAQATASKQPWYGRSTVWYIVAIMLAILLCLGGLYYFFRSYMQPKDPIETVPISQADSFIGSPDTTMHEDVLPLDTTDMEAFVDDEEPTIESLQQRLQEKDRQIQALQELVEKQQETIRQQQQILNSR